MKNFKNIRSPYIVAEIGNNHEGSFNNAIKLIKQAKKSGADAVKFQVFNPAKYASPKDTNRINQLKKFCLKKKDLIKIKKKCVDLKIEFFATPFDLDSANFLNKIQSIFKVSSGDNNFEDLLKKIRSFKKPTIISTGLMEYKEILKVVNYFRKINFYKKKENLCIMHCVSAYPASQKKINLNSIKFLSKKFPNITIGYSDHTKGYKVACASYLLGAQIIEKHFTLSNNFSNFRDHKISLNPKTFKNFVNEVKKFKEILGNFNKKINIEEKKNFKSMRRKILFNKNVNRGRKIKRKDLLIVRSIDKGIFASDIDKILGKKLLINKKKYQLINFKDITS
jgi:sialic acid synthase SpsE